MVWSIDCMKSFCLSGPSNKESIACSSSTVSNIQMPARKPPFCTFLKTCSKFHQIKDFPSVTTAVTLNLRDQQQYLTTWTTADVQCAVSPFDKLQEKPNLLEIAQTWSNYLPDKLQAQGSFQIRSTHPANSSCSWYYHINGMAEEWVFPFRSLKICKYLDSQKAPVQ